MAYGKPEMRPKRSLKRIGTVAPVKLAKELTGQEQKGKAGGEGASVFALPDFGKLPNSGPVEKNAGEKGMTGGHSAGLKGAMKGAGGKESFSGTAHAKDIAGPSHIVSRKPKKPGSSGGPRVGSIDTLTKLFFHPKGGFDNKAPAKRASPKGAGGYKDSGQRGGTQVTGVNH